MKETNSNFSRVAAAYLNRLQNSFTVETFDAIEMLANELRQAWVDGRNVYICGNGGSAANAMHMANDFHYGIGACGNGPKLPGLRVDALPANPGVLTCLANDTSYDNVYSHQLEVKGRHGDLLIALSGSGNSPNIVRALQTANALGMRSFAIVAYSGGRSFELADVPIHFAIDDMQIAEDIQLVVGHLCMQWLNNNKPAKLACLN